MAPSATPATATSRRSEGSRRPFANATRSRTSTGAVRWLSPTRTMPRSMAQNALPWFPSPSTFTPTSERTITAKPAMVSVAAQRPRQPAVMRPWRSTT